MVTLTIMVKTLAKLLQSKGYKLKVNKNSYLVFKSKEYFKNIENIERSLFDLVKYSLNGEDEDEQNYILMRMLKIEKYLETLPLTEIKIYELQKDELHKCRLEIKFPTIVKFMMLLHVNEEDDHLNY